ncbi:hypothetical protein [Deinococcus radiomollis]|uniref:hypothetical protein n=1 Tax=Deinococcus radiomollis TaxID=468916 RepID=UPI00389217BD
MEEAKRMGVRRLLADVTPADQAANADLLGWYHRHGFMLSQETAAAPTWQRLQRGL